MAFMDRLKAARTQAGLSQAELAEKAGMHRFGVAKLEQGVRQPTWETVQALAAALGTDCRAFVDAWEMLREAPEIVPKADFLQGVRRKLSPPILRFAGPLAAVASIAPTSRYSATSR